LYRTALAAALGEQQAIPPSRGRIGRIAEPREIAKAVVFMCSEDASFMVGSTMAVDGGMSAGADFGWRTDAERLGTLQQGS
jgi:NAD(P)-dependent dehydrogenase (short-subunit alcohol dehydrogenase family)